MAADTANAETSTRGPLDTTVAIVGAGMSGLIAARGLRRRGIDVLVLESADRVGGRMLAETSALGSRLDVGGQWVGHGHHRFAALAAELGTTVYPMRTPKQPRILDGGASVSAASPAALLATAVLAGWELGLRLGVPDRWQKLSVQDWLHKLPSRRARRLLEVFVAATTTSDPNRLSMHAFASIIRYEGGLSAMVKTTGGAQDSLIVEGAGTLVERLAAELGPFVRTGSRVTAIERADDGVTLRTASGVVHAATAIVTVPPPMAAAIGHTPPLPAARMRLQQNTTMGIVYKAIAVYRTPFWRAHTDAEALYLDEPGCAVFDTSPPDGPGHLCLLVGGPEARELDALGVAERQRTLLTRLADQLGSAAVLEPAGWHEKAWHRDEHAGGGYSVLPTFGTTDGYLPMSARPVGAIHWAGTETASEHAGYIEGAIESGERVAREVLAVLAAS